VKLAGWYLARFIIAAATLATTGWSLYAVARHFDTPSLIAGGAVAVFDGAAYACLHLAAEASEEGRSAAGARAATLLLAAVSVYLNITHSGLIGGGAPAGALFAVPTLALLAVSELSWAGPRAKARAARGEQPFRLPAFGGFAWLLAPRLAGKTVKARAIHHIEHTGQPSPKEASPARHTASEVLRTRFAEMDPADAIRIAADAQPGMPPAELAALLVGYGVIVDAVHVALALADTGPRISVERGDADTGDPDAEQTRALPPVTLSGAIVDAAAELGPEARAADIARLVEMRHRITVDEGYVRTALSRENRKAGGVGQGGGGYA
jgi:hypothetical protein